jgi:hypothetical protein
MGTSFEVFARNLTLTWNHLQSPYSLEVKGKRRQLKYERKAAAIACGFISAGLAAGASYVLDRSRMTIFLSAAGTALATFYAITGYFKWRTMQPPVEGSLVKKTESDISSKSTTVPVRKPGITSPGSSHTFEDFKQKPNWLIPQPTSTSDFLSGAINLHRETERKYFASLWKSMYEGKIAEGEHWLEYSDQDALLRTNKFSVEQGAPWEAFARFAQKYMQ